MSDTKPTELTAHAYTTGQVAAHLRALADAVDALGDQPIEKTWVNVSFQVTRPMHDNTRTAERFASVDLLASAFDGKPYTGVDGWRSADVFHGLTIYAAVEKPAEPVIEIRDQGWVLAAYCDGKFLGGARRTCVGGSRGQSWYWPIEVGAERSEGRRKADARAELVRLATVAAKAGAR